MTSDLHVVLLTSETKARLHFGRVVGHQNLAELLCCAVLCGHKPCGTYAHQVICEPTWGARQLLHDAPTMVKRIATQKAGSSPSCGLQASACVTGGCLSCKKLWSTYVNRLNMVLHLELRTQGCLLAVALARVRSEGRARQTETTALQAWQGPGSLCTFSSRSSMARCGPG